jgi:hypothetical protein
LLPFLSILLLLVALPVVFPLVTRPFNRRRVFGWIAAGVSISVIIIPFIVGFLFLLQLHNRADNPVAVQVPPLLTPLHNPPENQQYYQLLSRVYNPQDNQATDQPDNRAACLPPNRADYRQDNQVHDQVNSRLVNQPDNRQINRRLNPVDSQQVNRQGNQQAN